MRRRLYFLINDVNLARRVANDLLIARIDARRIHVLARRDADLGDLPVASMWQKSDIKHSALIGTLIGGLMGLAAGVTLIQGGNLFEKHEIGMALAFTLACATIGIWGATMIGISTPNSRLARFKSAIDDGKLLMMVDVPYTRVEEIEILVVAGRKGVMWQGLEAIFPVFP